MGEAVLNEIEEITTLIESNKSLAYASLLLLQRNSAGDASCMQTLSLVSPPLLPVILTDIYHQEEEIAAQALKCLGFMLYHPSLVSSISEKEARLALSSLSRLIVTTKMKAICNLGVWCFSVQQLDDFVIERDSDTLMRAVEYAIDNPFSSLSTSFEAIQALMKISTHLSKKLRENANIWLPPIYRRLVSNDKKEREIAERCIIKMKPIICPPPPTLSKALARDLKSNLLARIMDMHYDNHMKAWVIQAWGWYICLLGSSILKDRQLVNRMLKIPEQTFTNADPQVQIASLVAWERLIEAFLPLEVMNTVQETFNRESNPDCCRISERASDDLAIKDLLRRIKVLMVPLQGILENKCDISVHLSCLNTWNYLLHKLDLLVNHPLVLQTTFKAIIKVIFSMRPDNASICLWKPCLDVFDQYISQGIDMVPLSCPCDESIDRFPWINSIKWLPWTLKDLDFSLMIIKSIVSHSQTTQIEPEKRIYALSSALRMFKALIQAVKGETIRLSVPCDLTILKFFNELCEGMSLKDDWNQSRELLSTVFDCLEVVREELGYFVASPLVGCIGSHVNQR